MAQPRHCADGGGGRGFCPAAAAGAGKNCGYTHRRNPRGPWTGAAVFRPADPDGAAGIRPGEPAHRLRPENHPRPAQLHDGKAPPPELRCAGRPGARRAGLPVCRRRGHGGKPVQRRYHQHVCRPVQDRQHSYRAEPEKPGALPGAAVPAAAAVFLHKVCAEKYASRPDRQPAGRGPGFGLRAHHHAQYPHRPRSGEGALYVRALR